VCALVHAEALSGPLFSNTKFKQICKCTRFSFASYTVNEAWPDVNTTLTTINIWCFSEIIVVITPVPVKSYTKCISDDMRQKWRKVKWMDPELMCTIYHSHYFIKITACLLTQIVLTSNLFSITTLLTCQKVCLWYDVKLFLWFHWCLTVGNMFNIYHSRELLFMINSNFHVVTWNSTCMNISSSLFNSYRV